MRGTLILTIRMEMVRKKTESELRNRHSLSGALVAYSSPTLHLKIKDIVVVALSQILFNVPSNSHAIEL